MKACYKMPIGTIVIEERDGAIVRICIQKEPSEKTDCETRLIAKAHQELVEYFEGKRTRFDLPLSPEGTAFQKQVWRELQNIPYGETRSYGEIAASMGNPKACRAVGGANNKNPILIMIPCHRVIGANGAMVGFGAGIKVKEFLLDLECRTHGK